MKAERLAGASRRKGNAIAPLISRANHTTLILLRVRTGFVPTTCVHFRRSLGDQRKRRRRYEDSGRRFGGSSRCAFTPYEINEIDERSPHASPFFV
jgi:hypothetical protein